MRVTDFFSNKSNAATLPSKELEKELETRKISSNVFPLWAFNEKVQPYINALVNDYDIPRAYVGLAMLSAYSTAIGTAYAISTNGEDVNYLGIWACSVGMSSSGKTLGFSKPYAQLNRIQNQFDQDWKEETEGVSPHDLYKYRMKTVLFRDVHIPTLTRSVMPANPKGVCKFADEIIEWINGLGALAKGKDGTDEQFWLSSWNCSPYSGIRSGNVKFTDPRPFVNIYGGIQRSILYKLFAKDRDTTGFIFRLLFALPDGGFGPRGKIADPDSAVRIPKEILELHDFCIDLVYKELEVDDHYQPPKKVIVTRESNAIIRAWVKNRIAQVNAIEDRIDQEIHASIFGKMKEYATRFIGILAVIDEAYKHDITNVFSKFPNEIQASSAVTKRALEIADYFYNSAIEVYEDVRQEKIAPEEVLIASNMFKRGESYKKIAKVLYGDEKFASKAHRNTKNWIVKYPNQYKAENKK